MKKFISDSYYTAVVGKMVITDAPKMFDILFQLDWYRNLHETWLQGICHLQENANLLEVGCGPGQLSIVAASRGCQVVALDRSEHMLEKALCNIRLSQGITLVQASADDIPFDDGHFDIAIAASLINVVDEPEKVLREMARVVRPGGTVSFLVPSENMNSKAVSAYVKANRLQGLSSGALRMWGALAKKFSYQRCHELVAAAALDDIRVEAAFESMVYTVTGTVATCQ